MNASNTPISSIRVYLWLPLGIVLAVLLINGIFAAIEITQELNEVQQQARHTIELTASQLSSSLRKELESSHKDHLNTLISSLVLHDDVDLSVLTDKTLHVLASSRYAWQGRLLTTVMPQASLVHRSISDTDIEIIPIGNAQLGIIAIRYTLPDNPRSQDGTALLWLQVNTSRNRNTILLATGERLAIIFGIVALLTLILLWALHRHVTQPIHQLADVTKRIADGDLDVSLRVQGRGEIADLGHAMQHMVSRIRETISALSESEQRLSITLDSIGDAVLVSDPQGLVVRMNAMAEQLTGWPAKEALGHPVIEVFQIINAETRVPAEHPVGRVLREGTIVGLANHTTLIARDGTEYQIADSAAPIRDQEGRIIGVIMVFQDVTERYAMESQIRRVKERLHAILTSLPDPCFLLDEEGRYLDVLGGPQELLAKDRELLLGKRVQDVLSPEQATPIMRTIEETIHSGVPQRIEYEIDTLSGRRLFEGTSAPVKNEGHTEVVWLARDYTARKEAEEQLQHLARYDQLTGLANRTMTSQRLEQIMNTNRRGNRFGAVMFIDVDRFKTINDSLGHQLGDELLRQIGGILSGEIRTEDVAARFGGDEFVIVLGDLGADRVAASTHAELVAEKLRQICAEPLLLDEQPLQVTISIGVVLFPDDGSGVEELLKRADIAMYKAKEAGRNRICFFSPELQEIAESRLTIQRELRTALEDDQFQLYIQPRVDGHRHWIGGEVLVRWQHPRRGLLLPGSFIPVAETSGLIDDIDHWVISHAITGLARAQEKLPRPFAGLSMNITADLLLQPGFRDEIQYWCMQNAISPEQLELEITERVLLEDHTLAADVIEDLRRSGIHFSIDDFGTGYSSLRYLQRLPLNTLKIDKSFVERLPGHTGDARIVTTIIDMAKHLALDLIAEGVETEEQADFLKAQGCEQFQGYLYARPMPWDEFFQALPEHQPPNGLS